MSTISKTIPSQPAPKKEYSVTSTSVIKITGGRPIVVSYGYSTADWTQTAEALGKLRIIQQVWDWSLSNDTITHASSSGAELVKIDVDDSDSVGSERGSILARRKCKAGLINVIFHNYRMMKNGINDFTPVLFNVDLTRFNGKKPITKFSRTTSSEIEILRKLCTDEDLPKDFREIARKTVKFIHVKEEVIYKKPSFPKKSMTSVVKYSFTEVDAPWTAPGYFAHRASVKAKFLADNPTFVKPEGSKFNWKGQLQDFLDPEMEMGLLPVQKTDDTGEMSTVSTDSTKSDLRIL